MCVLCEKLVKMGNSIEYSMSMSTFHAAKTHNNKYNSYTYNNHNNLYNIIHSGDFS